MRRLFIINWLLLIIAIKAQNGKIITNCANCPTNCTPLSDNSNVGQCCGIQSSNTTSYCNTYCVEHSRVCCGCNYVNGNYNCVSCLVGDICTFNNTPPIVYACYNSIGRAEPLLFTIGLIVLGIFVV